jgi:hypothetical protein
MATTELLALLGKEQADLAVTAADCRIAGFTGFETGCVSGENQHGERLLPATPANKRLLEAWVDEEVRAAGGTQFDVR